MIVSDDLTVTTVRVTDVLILRMPQTLNPTQKQDYLNWFCGTLKGTSLEGCKVVLLDAGADVQVFRGNTITT